MNTLTAPPRAGGRLEHRAKVERAILAATHALLHDRSAAEVTIADIMDAVGLSRTAFYRYFPDVNSVLVRLLREVQAEFVSSWRDDEVDADFEKGLMEDWQTNVARFEEHAPIIRACLEGRTSAPELYAAWLQVVEEVVTRTAGRIEDLSRRDVIHVRNPIETARALVTFTIYYVTEGLVRVDDEGRAALADTLMEVWYRTLFGQG